METQGIVIWARSGNQALIVWCADCGALAYVADRRMAGDPDRALSVGDFVDLRVEVAGAMRVGRDLRFRAAGAGWVRGELGRERPALDGPVMSPNAGIAGGIGFGIDAVREALSATPANRVQRKGPGAA